MNATFAEIWDSARNPVGLPRLQGPRLPGAVVVEVLHGLVDQPRYGRELAAHIGRSQTGVLKALSWLDQLGFAEIDFVIQGSRGGRAAEFWTLTPAGRELMAALACESVPA